MTKSLVCSCVAKHGLSINLLFPLKVCLLHGITRGTESNNEVIQYLTRRRLNNLPVKIMRCEWEDVVNNYEVCWQVNNHLLYHLHSWGSQIIYSHITWYILYDWCYLLCYLALHRCYQVHTSSAQLTDNAFCASNRKCVGHNINPR